MPEPLTLWTAPATPVATPALVPALEYPDTSGASPERPIIVWEPAPGPITIINMQSRPEPFYCYECEDGNHEGCFGVPCCCECPSPKPAKIAPTVPSVPVTASEAVGVARRFRCVLSDPPWGFKNYSQKGELKNANQHYPCMSVAEISALPVADVLTQDAALFLWVTGPFIVQAAEVARAWGFPEYSGLAFTWAKQSKSGQKWHFSTGYWTRHNAEICLLFTRKVKPERLACDVPELIIAPVREHSRKPDETHDRIERLIRGPRLEMFARQEREGWTGIGNALTGSDIATDLRSMASQPSLELLD